MKTSTDGNATILSDAIKGLIERLRVVDDEAASIRATLKQLRADLASAIRGARQRASGKRRRGAPPSEPLARQRASGKRRRGAPPSEPLPFDESRAAQ